MSVALARQKFIEALQGTSGMTLMSGTGVCVNGGKQMMFTYIVQMPDGSSHTINQTLNATDDHINAAATAATNLVTAAQAGPVPPVTTL